MPHAGIAPAARRRYDHPMKQTPSGSGFRSPALTLFLFILVAWLGWQTCVLMHARTTTTPMRMPPATPTQEPFRSEEEQTIAVFEAVSPSVVSVANRALIRGGIFGLQVYEVPGGAGSGFVWDREGHIISNYHVVHNASAISVTMRDGATYEARLVGVDPDHDLAVLHIDAPKERLTPVPLGSSRELRVGQRVLAIGNPFGLDTSLSVGIVSALGRTITSMSERSIYDVIQTDAAINPGNSGGPLLDSTGALIGINTAILSPSGAYAGVGFAVPVDTVCRLVPGLLRDGRVNRAGLGIRLVSDHICRKSGVVGAAILDVQRGSAADRAGLTGMQRDPVGGWVFGDVVTGVDSNTVTCVDDLLSELDRRQAGDALALTLRRGTRERRVRVTLQSVSP